MIRIALCGDALNVLNELLILLEQYRCERGRELTAMPFHSFTELMDAIKRGLRFDIMIFDLPMPDQNGIETAAEIRDFDRDVKMIFLTSSHELAVQSSTADACCYQHKPIQAERFFGVLDSVFGSCIQEHINGFLVQHKGGIARVVINQIEFCEIMQRTLFIHLASGQVLESTGSLEEMEKKLAGCSRFLRIHRSYLINLDYVQNISYRAATMSCMMEIPIPRGKYGKIKDAFLKNAFQNGQVKL